LCGEQEDFNENVLKTIVCIIILIDYLFLSIQRILLKIGEIRRYSTNYIKYVCKLAIQCHFWAQVAFEIQDIYKYL
jgi:hypothetical protein